MTRNWMEELLSAIADADRALASELIEAWAQEHSHEAAVTGLLTPTLNEFGIRWAAAGHDVSLSQGYVAAKVAEDLLLKILANRQATGNTPPTERGTVVLGNVQDDYHPLGRKMVAAFLRMAGWRVCDLGVDVEPAAFVDAAVANGARVIGASAMMLSTARNVPQLRAEINNRGLEGRVQLAVGGAVFKLRPELVAEFGGDGTAGDALQAPALIEQLWATSCRLHPEAMEAL
ncbi:MAG: cobalamin-dependent protein [Holophaga sp.]|nr:cobalamin-dependent protein [Holophaga sp.]